LPKLSVTIITRDEEANIERALRSVQFANEIVVVDSGSKDATCEIAGKFTDKVVFNQWPGHIKQKQYAVDMAENDWILSIDADEEVSKELADKILSSLSEKNLPGGFNVNRKSFYLGRWIEHSGWRPDRRIRLFNRRKAKWGGYDPHDRVECRGEVKNLGADLLHYPYKDIAHHLSTINSYTTIMAAELFRKGKTGGIIDILFRPIFAFFKKIFIKKAFLDGFPGLVIAGTTAVSVFFKYAKLRELQKAKKRG